MFNKSPAVAAIHEQKNSMDAMKDFVDLVNNPDKITAAHEKVRAEHTLTEEHVAKYQSALEFSDKYEGLANTYNQRVGELEAAEKSHAESVEKHSEKVKLDLSLIDERQEDLEAGERQLKADRQKLADDRAEMNAEFSAKMTPIDDEKEQNRKDAEANELERINLEKLRKKLESKKAKVQAAISEDEES